VEAREALEVVFFFWLQKQTNSKTAKAEKQKRKTTERKSD